MREDTTTLSREDHVLKRCVCVWGGVTLLEGMRLVDVIDILQLSKSRQGCFYFL